MKIRVASTPVIIIAVFALVLGTEVLRAVPLRPDEMFPRDVPGGFAGRRGEAKKKLLETGASKESEAAVAAGLEWLVKHQARDGSWSVKNFNKRPGCKCGGNGSMDNDIAATAFGLLPLLAAGNTHRADKESPYAKQVDAGLKYLLLNQNGEGEFHPNMYAQGLATMAVCEAYGMTGDPKLKGAAEKGIEYIVSAQSAEGGWRYAQKSRGYDTSVGGWQVMALKSGEMAGLTVPAETFKKCEKWLDHAGTPNGGEYGYTANSLDDARPANVNPALTAVGLLCREHLGWRQRNPELLAGVVQLRRTGPLTNNMYYSYHATQVMHHMGGAAWDGWSPKMRDALVAAQDDGKKEPHQKGSWYDPKDTVSSEMGGRIMTTSLSLLTLEVYYRHTA
jgi:hypothetical protein